MEAFLFACTLVVLIIRWIYLRDRFDALESRLAVLERASIDRVPTVEWAAPTPPTIIDRPEPPPTPPPPPPPQPDEPSVPESSVAAPLPSFIEPEAAPAAHRTTEDWEALIGGNWINKLGVFVAVVGIALLLNYAWDQLGAAGRVALSLGAGFALLISGVIFERHEKYRTFSYGLLGGGWAVLYTTVYAMYAVSAAKILDNAFVATILLLAVAAGMIVHSLKYRSQAVSGLAYFLAFATLAISEVTTFGVLMLVPLAASLLYIAYRNAWNRFALYGLIATYFTCGLHRDTGSPLWQAQGLFLLYWLLFEAFDLLRADPWLLPLNGLGFLALSAGKWTHAAPDQIWQLAAGGAALYLAATLARARSRRWKPAVLFNAALAATAIVLRLHHQWLPLALLIEGELFYLAGVRFRSAFLRNLAGAIFGFQIAALLAQVLTGLSPHAWEPVAVLNVAAFYVNRALQTSEVWYGYAAAGMAALVSGVEASDPTRGPIWSLVALAPFTIGWWRRLLDFRLQGYAFAILGAAATTIYQPYPPLALAIVAAVAYMFVQTSLWSAEERLGKDERHALCLAASCLTTMSLCMLVWRLVPGEYLGVAWLALALLLLEAGLRGLPDEFRVLSCIVGVLAAARVAGFDLSNRLALVSSALAYVFAWRAREQARGRVLDVAAWPATLFLMAGLAALLPPWAVSPSWALVVVVLAEFDRRSLRAQSFLLSAVVITRCLVIDLGSPQPALAIAPVILCFWAAMLRRELASRPRLYYSLLATVLLGALVYHEVTGSLVTVAWAVEAVVLLAGGFALRDRVLRLSGLALFLICTLKLFFWDLRNLETLPRIVSFIVLGLLLVTVSWIYTRFRDQVQRFL
jgi:uncharacterized membrane protein